MKSKNQEPESARRTSICPTLVDIDELAAVLRIHKGTIYNWVHRRKIPYVKVGRLVRFDLSEIAKYVDGCRIGPLAGKG